MHVEDLFTKILLICQEEELLSGTHLSIDGLKLSSNASAFGNGSDSTHIEPMLEGAEEKLEAIAYQAPKTACKNCHLRL